MIEFETLLPDIMVRAPECAEPTAISAIRDAFTELCEQCRAWRVDDTFTLPPDPRKPEILMAPAGTLLVEIDSVTHRGQELEPITIDEARHRSFGHGHNDPGAAADWWHTSGPPSFYTQEQPNTLIIVPRQGGERIHISAFMKPGPMTEAGPDWAMMEYRVQLRDGALARILDIPGQPFTDLQRAAVYASAWESAKNRAYAKWVQGQMRAPMRTRPQYF